MKFNNRIRRYFDDWDQTAFSERQYKIILSEGARDKMEMRCIEGIVSLSAALRTSKLDRQEIYEIKKLLRELREILKR